MGWRSPTFTSRVCSAKGTSSCLREAPVRRTHRSARRQSPRGTSPRRARAAERPASPPGGRPSRGRRAGSSSSPAFAPSGTSALGRSTVGALEFASCASVAVAKLGPLPSSTRNAPGGPSRQDGQARNEIEARPSRSSSAIAAHRSTSPQPPELAGPVRPWPTSRIRVPSRPCISKPSVR